MTTCPNCSGQSMADHPAGMLAWQHANTCLIRVSEDATADADHAHVAGWGRRFTRPATSAELTLLSALGYAIPTAGLVTSVERWTASVTRRTWPALASGGNA